MRKRDEGERYEGLHRVMGDIADVRERAGDKGRDGIRQRRKHEKNDRERRKEMDEVGKERKSYLASLDVVDRRV